MKKGMVVLVAVMLLLSSCAWMQKSRDETSPRPGPQAPNVTYYTFPDIPVPKELELVRERSFIYETPTVKAGVLMLSGNVDVTSLETYFKVNMVKNGWKFVNSYKYSDVILNFVKEERSSNIRMTRDAFNTSVEIWVGPTERPGQGPIAPKSNGFK
jgi:hypothetical protein